jgi:hypothetical protein
MTEPSRSGAIAAKQRATHTFSALHSCNPQAAETDDARTQKRGRTQIIQRIRKGKHKVRPDEGIFSISAINGVAGEGSRIAEVFKTVLTIPALAVGPANP